MNKVKVGFFSFTEITDPAEHRAYNEWHQLDHMPEQLPIPGIVYVVDAGVARVNRYNVRTGVTQLLVEPISKASAELSTSWY